MCMSVDWDRERKYSAIIAQLNKYNCEKCYKGKIQDAITTNKWGLEGSREILESEYKADKMKRKVLNQKGKKN